jgi:hypothetical protein
MNCRVALILTTATLGIVFACFGPPGLAEPLKRQPLVLQVGDVVRVKSTNVECAIARRDSVPVVECLERGRRSGSYGTLTGDRSVLVVRFATSTVARTVFRAQQHDVKFATCSR